MVYIFVSEDLNMTSVQEELIKIGVKDFLAFTLSELKTGWSELPNEKHQRLSKAYIAYLTAIEEANNKKFDQEFEEIKKNLRMEYVERSEQEYKKEELTRVFDRGQALVEAEFVAQFSHLFHRSLFLTDLSGKYIPHRWLHSIATLAAQDTRHLAWEQIFSPITDFEIIKIIMNDQLSMDKSSPIDVFAKYAWKYLEQEVTSQSQNKAHEYTDLYYFGVLYKHIDQLYQVTQNMASQVKKSQPAASPRALSPPSFSPRILSTQSFSQATISPRPAGTFQLDQFSEAVQQLASQKNEKMSDSEERAKDKYIQSIQSIISKIDLFLKHGGSNFGNKLSVIKKIQVVFTTITEKF
jgi:hypothetical protein